MHVYLCIHGKPNIHGEKIREFVHRPQFEPNCYVYQNRPLTLEEHEKLARKVADAHPDLRPYSRIVVEAHELKTDAEIETIIGGLNRKLSLAESENQRLKVALDGLRQAKPKKAAA